MEGWGNRPSLMKREDGRKEEQRRRVRGRKESHGRGDRRYERERGTEIHTVHIYISLRQLRYGTK